MKFQAYSWFFSGSKKSSLIPDFPGSTNSKLIPGSPEFPVSGHPKSCRSHGAPSPFLSVPIGFRNLGRPQHTHFIPVRFLYLGYEIAAEPVNHRVKTRPGVTPFVHRKLSSSLAEAINPPCSKTFDRCNQIFTALFVTVERKSQRRTHLKLFKSWRRTRNSKLLIFPLKSYHCPFKLRPPQNSSGSCGVLASFEMPV